MVDFGFLVKINTFNILNERQAIRTECVAHTNHLDLQSMQCFYFAFEYAKVKCLRLSVSVKLKQQKRKEATEEEETKAQPTKKQE